MKKTSADFTAQLQAHKVSIFIIIVLMLGLITIAYSQMRQDSDMMAPTDTNAPQTGSGATPTGSGALTPQAAEVALKNIFARAGLPVDEDPASSTVKNLDSVKAFPFFKDAKLGDVILFFRKARVAAILRPSESKIISSAQVVGEIPDAFETNGNTNSAGVSATVNIGILNGTKQKANLDKIVKLVKDTFKADINVTYQDTARKTDYKTTTIVDISGQNAGLAKSLAALVKGTVGDFPAGEKLPPSMKEFPEILIFIGSTLP